MSGNSSITADDLLGGASVMRLKRNIYGKSQWVWSVARTQDGRLKCPYCEYHSFRITPLKYHFLEQHVFLEEVVAAATQDVAVLEL